MHEKSSSNSKLALTVTAPTRDDYALYTYITAKNEGRIKASAGLQVLTHS